MIIIYKQNVLYVSVTTSWICVCLCLYVPALLLKYEYVASDVTDFLRKLLDEKVHNLCLSYNTHILKKIK